MQLFNTPLALIVLTLTSLLHAYAYNGRQYHSMTRFMSSTYLLFAASDAVTGATSVSAGHLENFRDLSEAFPLIQPGKLFRTSSLIRSSNKAKDSNYNYPTFFRTFVDIRSPEEKSHLPQSTGTSSLPLDRWGFYPSLPHLFQVSEAGHAVVSSLTKLDNQDYNHAKVLDMPILSEKRVLLSLFRKMSSRFKFKIILKYLTSKLNSNAELQIRQLFVDSLNQGGLTLLNEIMLDDMGKELVQILRIITDQDLLENIDKDNNSSNINSSNSIYPAMYYCTAGKDRTGLITMLLLKLLGASDDAIVADYVKSNVLYNKVLRYHNYTEYTNSNTYDSDINSNNSRNNTKESEGSLITEHSVVKGLVKSGMHPEVFLPAPAEVMWSTLSYLQDKYGSVEQYLAKYGFGKECIARAKRNLLQ